MSRDTIDGRNSIMWTLDRESRGTLQRAITISAFQRRTTTPQEPAEAQATGFSGPFLLAFSTYFVFFFYFRHLLMPSEKAPPA